MAKGMQKRGRDVKKPKKVVAKPATISVANSKDQVAGIVAKSK